MASNDSKSFTELGIPTHQQLVIPILQAVEALGGTGATSEINEYALERLPDAEELVEYTYPTRPELSVLLDRLAWGRSTAKRIGVLTQPSRGMYLITDDGEYLLSLPESEAYEKVRDLDRQAYAEDKKQREESRSSKLIHSKKPGEGANRQGADSFDKDDASDSGDLPNPEPDEDSEALDWKVQLLTRLHELTPEGFEKYVIYLLKRYGLNLQHSGGTGDEGVDAIGTAPLSPVLSSRVAVQVKRYAPDGKKIGRETVALFQHDARNKGAERAILVTLGNYTEPARRAATQALPSVDLINGDRLADLVLKDGNSGVIIQPTVDLEWFNQFD
ncbi:restriction endonuclease [Corynebacterium sp. L4756]|uniref:restriction endonuclease n=1 Tax=unclassified Corynebacterium TaxID=2624378 RepID=UPI00374CC0BE